MRSQPRPTRPSREVVLTRWAATAAVLTLFGRLAFAGDGLGPGELQIGSSLALRLEPGREATISVAMRCGSFARLHIYSRGLPVRVRAQDPDGIVSWGERRLPEGVSSLSWVATGAGAYLLTFAVDGGVGASVGVELAAQRPVTALDRRWVAIEQLMEDMAWDSQAPPSPSQLETSLLEARAVASQSSPCESAVIRQVAARAMRTTKEVTEALPLLEEAYEDAERCGARRLQALIALEVASARGGDGRYDDAARALDQASQAAASVPDRTLQGDVRLGRAQINTYRLDVDAAQRGYEDAGALFRESGDIVGEARTWLWLSYNRIAAGMPEKAAEAGLTALELWNIIGDRRSRARTLQSLGLANQSMGRTQRALEFYLEARSTLSPERDPIELAAVLTGVSELYLEAGAFDRGIEFARLASELNARRPSALADNLCMLARGHLATGAYEESSKCARRAVTIFKDLGDDRRAALAQRDLARALRAGGHLDDALPLLRDVEASLRGSNARYLEALVLADLGDAFAEQGQLTEAIARLERALAIQRSVGSTPDEVLVLANLARMRARTGCLKEALRESSQALARAEELRAALASFDLRTSYFSTVGEFYEFHVDLLMSLHHLYPGEGYDVKALEASEAARARTLVDRLREPDSGSAGPGENESLRRQERELAGRIDALARRIVSLSDEEERQNVLRLYTQARAEHDQVDSSLRAARPAGNARAPSVDVQELRTRYLDGQTALVEYFVGTQRSFCWVVGKEGVVSYLLPPRQVLEQLVARVETTVRSHLPRPAESVDAYLARVEGSKRLFEEAARDLSAVILAPWLLARPERRLLVVAHESLQHAPFAALPSSPASARPLIESHEIVRLPSAAALAALRGAHHGVPVGSRMLVLADPVYSAGDPRVPGRDPDSTDQETVGSATLRSSEEGTRGGIGLDRLARLPASGDEAAEIGRIAGTNVTIRRGVAATREMLVGPDAAGFSLIHIAAHSFANDARPELSAVVLSMVDERGRPSDGLVLLDDVYRMKLTAELVVLSACETALGRDVRGEGVVGLARGFFHAGARRVIASLWRVDDRATQELMRLFYAKLVREGLPPAAALRSAQIQMSVDPVWSFPFYWSGFELHGDWR